MNLFFSKDDWRRGFPRRAFARLDDIEPIAAGPEDELAFGCCQSNANPSPLVAGQQVLHNEKFAPFAKGGVT